MKGTQPLNAYGRALREEQAGAPAIEWPARTSGYVGEAWIRLEYRGEIDAPFRELYVDSDMLGQRATRAGWMIESLHRGEEGGYLVSLTRQSPTPAGQPTPHKEAP